MELHSLGGYRLVRQLPTRNTVCRLYLAAPMDPQAGNGGSGDAEASILLKLLMPGSGPEHATVQAQFEHESRLLSAFNHPSIPSFHTSGSQDGVAYLAMDYVDGVDLATLLGHPNREPRALSKEVAVYMMGQLADALRHVHTFEVVDEEGEFVPVNALHRDLCPANVFLSRHGDVLLGDFGSAASIWLPPEHTARDAGSKAYMAPERVIGGGEATLKTDLFSLAVILWEVLKGQRCLWAEDEVRTMETIARFDVSHSSRRIQGLSPKLSEIVRRNLDRDPERRYVSAFQVLQRLAQAPEAASAEQSRLELAALVAQVADGDKSGADAS